MNQISKYIFFKFNYSIIICTFSLFSVFFIFSLLGNLGEQYNFNQTINLSLVSTIQIFFYIPMFIFFLILLFFIIDIRSKNELLIISHYLRKNYIHSIFIFYLILFSFLEINKNLISEKFEDFKVNKFYQDKSFKYQLLLNETNKNNKEFILIKKKNINEIRSINIFKIENSNIIESLYSSKVELIGDKIILKNPFQQLNNKIEQIEQIEKIYANFTKEFKKNKRVIHFNYSFFNDLTYGNLIKFIFNIFTLYICLILLTDKYTSHKANNINIKYATCIFLIFYSSIFLNINLIYFNKIFIYLGFTFLFLVFLKNRVNE